MQAAELEQQEQETDHNRQVLAQLESQPVSQPSSLVPFPRVGSGAVRIGPTPFPDRM